MSLEIVNTMVQLFSQGNCHLDNLSGVEVVKICHMMVELSYL